MNTIKAIEKNKTTGERLPKFVNDLLALLEPSGKTTASTPSAAPATLCIEDKQSDDDDEQHLEDSDDGPDAKLPNRNELSRLRSVHPGRRLPKREASHGSEADTVMYDDLEIQAAIQAENKAKKHCSDNIFKKPSSNTKSSVLHWVFGGIAHRQRGTDLDKSDSWTESGGFKLFIFDDGEEWLSEEPILDDDSEQVLKRPAAIVSKKTVHAKAKPKSSPWKLLHSKVYHKSKQEFVNRCRKRGIEVDHEAMHDFVQEQIAKAKKAFDTNS